MNASSRRKIIELYDSEEEKEEREKEEKEKKEKRKRKGRKRKERKRKGRKRKKRICLGLMGRRIGIRFINGLKMM
jgi:hypothetical protein